MSSVKFEVIDCRVKESYWLTNYEDSWNDEEHRLINIIDENLKKLSREELKKQNIELAESEIVVVENPFGAIITLKHNETNTTLVIEVSNFDHDGNELYLETGDITKDFKFEDKHIIELLSGLEKYNTKTTIVNNILEIEPNNNCWLEFTNFDLEGKLENNSLIDIVLCDYSGKTVYIDIDWHGAIFSVKELKDLNEIEYIDVYSDIYVPKAKELYSITGEEADKLSGGMRDIFNIVDDNKEEN